MKSIKKVVIGFIVLFVAISLLRNIINYQKTLKFYESYKAEYKKEKQRNTELKTRALRNSDPESMERVLRNKLNLARDGELVVIVPSPTPLPYKPLQQSKPVYRQWIEVFFQN